MDRPPSRPPHHRRSTRIVSLVATGVALVGASMAAAQPVEKFEVVSVDAAGCSSGDFEMTVRPSNLDADLYIVRTRVQVGSQLYMNEHGLILGNGPQPWSVFNVFDYGIVPNRGAYPIDSGGAMRLDFTLERPKGRVLSSWTLVVDGCDRGGILYSAGAIFVDGFGLDGTSRWSSTVG